MPLAQCELVDPQHSRRHRGLLGQGAYQAKKGGAADRDGEGVGQAGAGPAGEHQPELLQRGLELLAASPVPEGDAFDLFDERRPLQACWRQRNRRTRNSTTTRR